MRTQIAVLLAAIAGSPACSNTPGLMAPCSPPVVVVDAGVDAGPDAGSDAGVAVGVDAGVADGVDAGVAASVDAGVATSVDAGVATSSTCLSGLTCMVFSAPAADGICGSGGYACTLPCTTDADCAPLGKGVTCSSKCGTPVCTPYQ